MRIKREREACTNEKVKNLHYRRGINIDHFILLINDILLRSNLQNVFDRRSLYFEK